MTHVQTNYWFRSKRYGYGAEPANWKGWLASGLYVALVAAITWQLILDPAQAVLGWATLVAVTLAFVWLCRNKTDGTWRWRWGTRD